MEYSESWSEATRGLTTRREEREKVGIWFRDVVTDGCQKQEISAARYIHPKIFWIYNVMLLLLYTSDALFFLFTISIFGPHPHD